MDRPPEPTAEERREQADRQRRDRDLEALRILARCVQLNRYSAEPMRVEGGRRGKARIATFTFYIGTTDLNEARDAVREIVRRRDS